VHTVAELSVASDRPRYALDLLIERASATGGCLYLFDGSSLELVASKELEEPTAELEQRLLQELQRSQAILAMFNGLDGDTRMVDSLPVSARPSLSARSTAPPANDQLERFSRSSSPTGNADGQVVRAHMLQAQDERHRIAVLTAERHGLATSIGGVILALSAEGGAQLDVTLLRAVGQAISG
jgi:hypothetical protein